MGFDYGVCGWCKRVTKFTYMKYCNFCEKFICEQCEDDDEIIDDEYLECDQNGKFIKPDDYNCISCDNQQRHIEMVEEILKLVPETNIEKCKQLIEEIIEEIIKK